ncbi:hypothetical protein H6F67_26810 [Microcoleus sp. FACHB-1515]|uniref:DUF6745 domain-containing protein n=1 Tax=Cyanophyceae TaxID=3028117 RepID=UPI0016860368|nr:hypothetical protein [Microcoleus sp. FACHB-1515]MBD2093456.1 hypothetical protein [Microcoleus sp. FACHB-1515]
MVESPWQALKLRNAWNKPPALQDFAMLLQSHVAQLLGEIEAQIDRRLLEILHVELAAPLQQVVTESLTSPIVAAIAQQQDLTAAIEANQILINGDAQAIAIEQWLPTICLLDYAIDVLNCAITNFELWRSLRSLVSNCGWIVPISEQLYLVSDRPVRLCINSRRQLHAESGVTALAFSDGMGLYARLGQLLPERYGKIPEDDWHGRWVAEEPDPQLKQLLIEGIGYERLSLELAATQLDAQWDYQLLHWDAALVGKPLTVITQPGIELEVDAVPVPIDIMTVEAALEWVAAQPGGGWPEPLSSKGDFWECWYRTPIDGPMLRSSDQFNNSPQFASDENQNSVD